MPGTWTAFSSYQDATGVWHAGPTVSFTVLAPPPPPPPVLTISSPLAITPSSVFAGETVTGVVTWKNASATAITARQVAVTALPPGVTPATGPWVPLAPVLTPGSIPAGGTLSLTATRTVATTDPLGTWTAYASYQDSSGVWQSGPTVPFSVAARPPRIWVTAYYAAWHASDLPPSEIDFTAFSHLCHFSLVPRADGSLDTTTHGSFAPADCAALVTPAHAAGCKVLIGVGGAGTVDAFRAAIGSGVVGTFVSNLVTFVSANHYDGIDVDMEPLTSSDQASFASFIGRLRAALTAASPSLQLTVALGLDAAPIVAPIQGEIDHIHLMTYDMAGLWQGWDTWHNTALHDGGVVFSSGGRPTSCDRTVRDYLAAGIPASKLGIGMEFYGYIWTNATGPLQSTAGVTIQSGIPYSTIMSSLLPNGVYHWDSGASVPYLSVFEASSQFVSYDDATSCSQKVDYARSNGLGGVIIWELWGGYRADQPSGSRDALLQAVKTASQAP